MKWFYSSTWLVTAVIQLNAGTQVHHCPQPWRRRGLFGRGGCYEWGIWINDGWHLKIVFLWGNWFPFKHGQCQSESMLWGIWWIRHWCSNATQEKLEGFEVWSPEALRWIGKWGTGHLGYSTSDAAPVSRLLPIPFVSGETEKHWKYTQGNQNS